MDVDYSDLDILSSGSTKNNLLLLSKWEKEVATIEK